MLKLALLISVVASSAALAQATVIEDPAAADRLMGDHVFNLQWIDNPPGVAHVTEKSKGELVIDAEQRNQKGDLATVTGKITRVTTKTFELDGTVVTRVSYNYGGKSCEKSGHFTFRITSGRKYWRLKEMDNCEGKRVVDYVDVFFERPKAAPKKE